MQIYKLCIFFQAFISLPLYFHYIVSLLNGQVKKGLSPKIYIRRQPTVMIKFDFDACS